MGVELKVGVKVIDFYQAFFECFEVIFYKLSYAIDN